jgi:hypothetical protein
MGLTSSADEPGKYIIRGYGNGTIALPPPPPEASYSAELVAAVLCDHDAVAAVLTTKGRLLLPPDDDRCHATAIEWEAIPRRMFSHAVLGGNGRLLVCERAPRTGFSFP